MLYNATIIYQVIPHYYWQQLDFNDSFPFTADIGWFFFHFQELSQNCEKRLLPRRVCLSVCPSTWDNSAQTYLTYFDEI